MNNQATTNKCPQIRFGLIVTGKGEKEFLPHLFQSLTETGSSHFRIFCRTGQRSPITSPKKRQKMVGCGKTIPDKDATQIGLPARQFLQDCDCNFVILIDDLEHDQRPQAQEKYNRYRAAIDTMLEKRPDLKPRASVHLLVNMVEAYYFADAVAINCCLSLNPPLQDDDGDVETIHHPKNRLKNLYPGFDERRDGAAIMLKLRVEHILARSDACAWLRTLFAWCIEAILERSPYPDVAEPLINACHLEDGVYSPVTSVQLRRFGRP